MIIKPSDIRREEGQIKLPQLGGETLTGYAKISLHIPTGVVFMQINEDNDFKKFVVGIFSKQSTIEELREYTDKNEETFFQAVKYFEGLIEKLMPKEDEKPPSIGKFYFYKEKCNKQCKAIIFESTEIIVQRMDIPIVFSPPKTKPYGRLNMTVVDKPEYELISSKFALKYDEQATKEDEGYNQGFYTLSDFAIYDMIPYQNSENTQGESPNEGTPEDVNDSALNPNDIEDENMNDKENKQNQEQKDNEEEEGGGGQKRENREDNQNGENEQDDSQGNKDNQQSKNSQETDSNQEGQDSQEQTNSKDESQELSEQQKEQKGRAQGSAKNVETAQRVESTNEVDVPIYELVPGLEAMFSAKQGLKQMFKKQQRLISSLDSFKQNELNEIYKRLNIPEDYPKSDFINLVKEKTKNIF